MPSREYVDITYSVPFLTLHCIGLVQGRTFLRGRGRFPTDLRFYLLCGFRFPNLDLRGGALLAPFRGHVDREKVNRKDFSLTRPDFLQGT